MGPELKRRVSEPLGMAVIPEEAVRVQGEHPVCGDRMAFGAEEQGGALSSLRFQASACPACLAVASCAVEVYEGAPLPGGPEYSALRSRVQELGGLARHEGHALKFVESLLASLRGALDAEA